jgi:hypothetical protein
LGSGCAHSSPTIAREISILAMYHPLGRRRATVG